MRVLVIGGSGFIGRFLVPQILSAGHEVAVVQRPDSTTPIADSARAIQGDRRRLRDYAAALRTPAPDVVIDLILSSGRQAAELMDVFSGYAGRVVAITSMDVYRAVGILHGTESGPLEPLPLGEDSPLRTTFNTYPPALITVLQKTFSWLDDEYDKIPVERAVLGRAELPGIVLRLPMIYGPGDRLHRLFPMLKRMDDRRPTIVLAKGVAGWRGPRGYIENVASAIALVALSGHLEHRIYNVGEAQNRSELEWARAIAAAVGWHGEFVLVDEADVPPSLRQPGNFEQHWVVDTTRIRSELDYTEPVPLDVALQRTVDWERLHPPPLEAAAFDYAAEDEAARSATADRVASG